MKFHYDLASKPICMTKPTRYAIEIQVDEVRIVPNVYSSELCQISHVVEAGAAQPRSRYIHPVEVYWLLAQVIVAEVEHSAEFLQVHKDAVFNIGDPVSVIQYR